MALLDIVIDVSDAQGQIDWATVAAAGIAVAMIKATEGATVVEKTWVANSAGARAAGLKIIPYHFMTNALPADQVRNFTQAANLAAGCAYALDWEPETTKEGADITAAAAQVEAVGRSLAGIVGRNPLGYWGIPGNTPPGQQPTPFMATWDRWVPRYRHEPMPDFASMPTGETTPFNPPGGVFLFWQYTRTGSVGGINSTGANKNVDRSVASFDDDDALITWCTTAPAA